MFRLLLLLFFAFNTCYGMNGPNLEESCLVDGENLTDEEIYPYMVSIKYVNNDHHCGGSIIAKRTVLTAAHCITRAFYDYYVVAGTNYWAKGGSRYRAEEIKIHPEYNETERSNDVGLVIVNRDFVYSDKVQRVSLSPAYIDRRERPFLIGWGKPAHGESHLEVYKFLQVYTMLNYQCEEQLEDSVNFNTSLCLYFTGSNGDDGSPVVYRNAVIGMISWTDDDCVTGKPGVITRISYYYSWILDNAGAL